MRNNLIIAVCDLFDRQGKYSNGYENILKACELAQLSNSSLYVICYTDVKENIDFNEIQQWPADKIEMVKLKSFDYQTVLAHLEGVLRILQPQLVIFPNTGVFKAVSAMTATTLKAGLTADCIDIGYNEQNQFIFSRAAINASVMAQIICINHQMAFCTVKRNVFLNYISDKSSVYNKYNPKIKLTDFTQYKNKYQITVTKTMQKQQDKISSLEKADIVIGIGRGISKAGIENAKCIAERFNARIGCTRCLVEDEAFDKGCQIGQSGTSIGPRLYIAFGVSGASQHLVGIQNAQEIISINSDSDANIFKYSNYNIKDDANKILQIMGNS